MHITQLKIMCCNGRAYSHLLVFTASICFILSRNGRVFGKSSETLPDVLLEGGVPGHCAPVSSTRPWYLHCIAECLELIGTPGSAKPSANHTTCYFDEQTALPKKPLNPADIYGECAGPSCVADPCQPQQTKAKNLKSFSVTDFFATVAFSNKTKACGRYYLVTAIPDKHATFLQRCCANGMKILSIDSKAEYDCLTDTIRNDMKRFGPFWTSGSPGSPCPGGFAWCSTGRVIDEGAAPWLPGEPSRQKGEDCVTLNVQAEKEKTGLIDDPCTKMYRGICEGDKP